MKKCKHCNSILIKVKSKFCSKRCSCIHRNIHNHPRKGKGKGKPNCATNSCSNKVVSYGHKFCRECIDSKKMNIYSSNPTKGELVKEYTKRNHRSSAYSYIRWHARAVVMKNYDKESCHKCGYDKHTEVCHVTPIKNFEDSVNLNTINHPDNLMLLCPNCHWENDHLLS